MKTYCAATDVENAWPGKHVHVLCPLFVYFVNQYAIPAPVGFLRNLFTHLFVCFLKNFGQISSPTH